MTATVIACSYDSTSFVRPEESDSESTKDDIDHDSSDDDSNTPEETFYSSHEDTSEASIHPVEADRKSSASSGGEGAVAALHHQLEL